MDSLKVRLFIKNLTYDLNTVRYLLDYGRLKETVVFMDRILNSIDSIRGRDLGEGGKNIFSEDFWAKRLPAGVSFSEMRANIKKYSQIESSQLEEDLIKIKYEAFIDHVFDWSEKNISILQHISKSPLQKKVEKTMFYLIGIIVGLLLVFLMGWMIFTQSWGLKGDFFEGQTFKKCIYSGYKKTINFSNPHEMDSRLPDDNFSARWTGNLLVPKEGEYTIFETSDDGAKVFIDGKLLITDWVGHSSRESSQKVVLSQGPHRIILEYFQKTGRAVLLLSWASNGSQKEIIPAKYLRH